MRVLGWLVSLSALGGRLFAQGTVTVANSPAQVPSPTATEYSSGTSLFSPTTGAMTVTGNCASGGNDCSIKIAANSSILSLDFSISSDPTAGFCIGGGPGTGVATAVTTTPMLMVKIKQQKSCTLVVVFRVKSLSYTSHTVAGSPYTQALTFTITSP